MISLGEEIRALDLDMDMPDADAEAKRHYGVAVEHYQLAEQALEGARRPEDLRGVSERLEEGRFEMEAARALLEGRPVPGAPAALLLRPAPRAVGGGRRVGAAGRPAAVGARLRGGRGAA